MATINHESIRIQKANGQGGRFGEKRNTAPSTGLSGPAASTVPDEFYDVWDGSPDSAEEAYAWAALSGASVDVSKAARSNGAADLVRDVERKDPDDVAVEWGLSRTDVEIIRRNLKFLPSALEAARKVGAKVRTRAEGGIPTRLFLLGDKAPNAIWIRGNEAALDRLDDAVSVTGARACTSYGEHIARELGERLAEADRPLVTGGAYGVAAAAMRGALASGSGAQTITFAAGGVDRDYPAGNTGLLESARVDGVTISDALPGMSPTKSRFLRAAELQGVAARTVVVEGSARSGSLIVANTASATGNKVYAIPGPITSVQSDLPNQLIAEGKARALTSTSIPKES